MKFIKEKVEDRTVSFEYVNTRDQLANIFTKPLSRLEFQNLIPLSGLIYRCDECLIQGDKLCYNNQTCSVCFMTIFHRCFHMKMYVFVVLVLSNKALAWKEFIDIFRTNQATGMIKSF